MLQEFQLFPQHGTLVRIHPADYRIDVTFKRALHAMDQCLPRRGEFQPDCPPVAHIAQPRDVPRSFQPVQHPGHGLGLLRKVFRQHVRLWLIERAHRQQHHRLDKRHPFFPRKAQVQLPDYCVGRPVKASKKCKVVRYVSVHVAIVSACAVAVFAPNPPIPQL